LGLVLGITVTDWLDGPLARRLGPTRLGRLLDLEADSWLTLWAAVAAYRRGVLPGWIMLAPAARYVVLLLRGSPPQASRTWQRLAGGAHMAVLAGALAPWPWLVRPARSLAALAAAGQLSALAADLVPQRAG
jgi:phosphatidylglycerophosphate synthase